MNSDRLTLNESLADNIIENMHGSIGQLDIIRESLEDNKEDSDNIMENLSDGDNLEIIRESLQLYFEKLS